MVSPAREYYLRLIRMTKKQLVRLAGYVNIKALCKDLRITSIHSMSKKQIAKMLAY